MSSTAHSATLSGTTHRLLHGVVGGLAGGVVFGVLMQMMGMITMVAQLVGSQAAAVGWLVHLAISAFAGALFALLLGSRAVSYGPAVLLGLGYGVAWWVVGALLIMPAQLGMDVFVFDTAAWQSLMGHLLFGLALGLAYAAMARRSQH